jgi:N-acetyl-anhydromuramyl-L-alanine amidase AmpD
MGAKCFYRPCFLPADDGEGDCGDGVLWGQRVVDQINANGHHWPDYIGFRNELNPTSGNAAQYQRYRATLRASGYTGPVVYGSFGNGRPDWPEYATIPADADALEIHEYWTGTVAASPDLALRHIEAIKRNLIPATLPLILGEIGEWAAGHGWQQDTTADQMTAQLAIYRAGCAPSVVAVFVFADGNNGDPQWDSFKTRNTSVETAIRATWTKTPPPTPKGIHMDYSKATWSPSPNFWTGRQGQTVKALVLHGTAGPGAVSWFANTASQVSAHYVVDTDGSVTQCVAEADSAWHAGVVTSDSAYAGGPNPNLWTIGIEHVRDVSNTSAITQAQLTASLALVEDITKRYGPLALILHNQIDVGRVCPGPGFPLQSFQDVVTPPQQPYADSLEKDAANYYFQRGKSVDRSHALWTACLLPLWRRAQQLKLANDPLAPLFNPGPIDGVETAAQWGGIRPAATIALTNMTVGVYLDLDNQWKPFRPER